MNQNLANVYALLMDSYGEAYTISYTQPPSFLESIVGEDELCGKRIVFVRLENRHGNKNTNIVSPNPLNTKKTSPNNLDLTGSPLKDDCVIDTEISIDDFKLDTVTPWKLEEEYQKGLSVEKARKILGIEKLQAHQNANGSVWILCDGADAAKTLFLQFEFSTAYISRGFIKFMGFLPTSALNAKLMLKEHGASNKVETFIENVYELKSDISIRCSWSTTAPLPTLVDSTSCDVLLLHKFYLNDCNVFTQEFVNQLRMLACIRKDIIAYKESGNSSAELKYPYGTGVPIDDLSESINSLMTEFSCSASTGNGNEIEHDIERIVQMAQKRRLNDLTDQLWDLLKRCSSYNDLKSAFHIIFRCAARCGIVNTPANNNRLAEIITEVSNTRLAIPCLSGSEPLELLLEIGLEKLYKDYEFIFTESKICSANNLMKTDTLDDEDTENANGMANYRKSLHNAIKTDAVTPRKTLLHNINAVGKQKQSTENVLGFRNSNFDENESAMKLAKLLQIHCTLEHLLTLQIHLNLQDAFSDICKLLLNRALKPFDTIEDTFVDQMEITISPHNICEHLDGKDPNARRITFKSKNKFRQQTTTFFYSMDNVCPPQISTNFENEEKNTIKENIYYSWMYQKVQTAK